MASTFKNAGISVPVVDTSAGNLFAAGASSTAVIHALYISNKSTTASATVDVKVTTDGGSTFYHIGKGLEVPPNNTFKESKIRDFPEPESPVMMFKPFSKLISIISIKAIFSIFSCINMIILPYRKINFFFKKIKGLNI